MKPIIALFILIFCINKINAQEFIAKVNINSSRVTSNTDKKIFTTLQTALNNFINNRKWTSETFAANEKIETSFNITITNVESANVFEATLAIQAARPIFNSSYKSPQINFVDDKLKFKYVEFQAIDFNENRVQGNDALTANLPAVLAYYVYLILGMDYDSYELNGGTTYFTKAQNIVTNALSGNGIEGWTAFDSQRNRYWLSENFNNQRYITMHEIIYNYYRKGMDFMYEDENTTRTELLNCLTMLSNLKKETGNTNMVIQFFMQSRSNEWINVFKKADPTIKLQAMNFLKEIDITNASKYDTELK
jgi:hypothetical protein